MRNTLIALLLSALLLPVAAQAANAGAEDAVTSDFASEMPVGAHRYKYQSDVDRYRYNRLGSLTISKSRFGPSVTPSA